MPPKKLKLQEVLPNKIIKVKKLDTVKTINEPETTEIRSNDSIIKSTVKILEPIVEIVKNESNNSKKSSIDTINKPTIKIKKNLLKPKSSLEKTPVKDTKENEVIEEHEEHEEEDNKQEDNKQEDNEEKVTEDNEEEENEEKEDNEDNEEKGKNNDVNNNNNKDKPKTIKEQKKDKIHNHSKPKTIIASTKDVNTVDMFGEDDLDFRYVMMNYDYTKNVTMPKITKYERALLIGKRAKQIEEGANPNVKYISGQSVVSIAEEELRQRKIPLIIKRPIGNKFEYWKPADMEVNMD